MQFDLFHSIGRVDNLQPKLSDKQVFENFFAQTNLADELGFNTIWVAESHFSSEVQKRHPNPVIPNYLGEVGLNNDSCQLAQKIFQSTKNIGFGTAIYNIVGGNGGPIGAADRIRSLAFLNEFQSTPRQLDIGIAQGRFPYINQPYGIFPRNELEKKDWANVNRMIFLEALEIFLRLSLGETISDQSITKYPGIEPRWIFDELKLVPEIKPNKINFILGSTDPLARQLAFKLCDIDLFNLSFTPPEQINALHDELATVCQPPRKPWKRNRLPRTVLVFIDKDAKTAQKIAHQAFDTYIDAMQGTVKLPPKEALMARALIGNAEQVIEQLSPDDPHDFRQEDRLMLWFEFNQSDNAKICERMQYFYEQVKPHV